jgi:DNA-binding PadR family transcriptional regulator
MRGAPSPVTGVLLGLLLERAGYAYEFAQRVNERMGPAWRLTPSSVYPLLDRLESQGLARRVVKGLPGRPRQRERVIYHPTDKTRTALERWMARPVRKEPLRTELIAKIAVARPEDAPLLLAALDDYERDCLLMSQASHEDRPRVGAWSALLANLIDVSTEVHLKAELQWVSMARRLIGELATDVERG